MLPFLEHAALYEELRTLRKTGFPRPPSLPLNVPQFHCPDDDLYVYGDGNSNYLFNTGAMFSYIEPRNGFINTYKVDTNPAEIVDGLSNTCAMSERLVGVPGIRAPSVSVMEREPRRYFWFTAVRYNMIGQEPLAVEPPQPRLRYPSDLHLSDRRDRRQ